VAVQINQYGKVDVYIYIASVICCDLKNLAIGNNIDYMPIKAYSWKRFS